MKWLFFTSYIIWQKWNTSICIFFCFMIEYSANFQNQKKQFSFQISQYNFMKIGENIKIFLVACQLTSGYTKSYHSRQSNLGNVKAVWTTKRSVKWGLCLYKWTCDSQNANPLRRMEVLSKKNKMSMEHHGNYG